MLLAVLLEYNQCSFRVLLLEQKHQQVLPLLWVLPAELLLEHKRTRHTLLLLRVLLAMLILKMLLLEFKFNQHSVLVLLWVLLVLVLERKQHALLLLLQVLQVVRLLLEDKCNHHLQAAAAVPLLQWIP